MKIIIDQECVFNSVNQRCFVIPADSDDVQVKIIDFSDKNLLDRKPRHISLRALSECAEEICYQLDNLDITQSFIEYTGVSDIPFIFLAAHRLKAKGIQLNDIGLWHNFREPLSLYKGWTLLGNTLLTDGDIKPLSST